MQRTKVAAKFIPMYGRISPGEMSVQSDRVALDGQTLSVNETAITPIVEIIAAFKLTLQQVEREQESTTTVGGGICPMEPLSTQYKRRICHEPWSRKTKLVATHLGSNQQGGT
jgi:hypothetical protein